MWRHREVIRRGWPYTKGHRGKLTSIVFFTIVLFILALAQPLTLAYFLDDVIGGRDPAGLMSWAAGFSLVTKIGIGVGFMVVLALLTNGLTAWSEALQAKFEQNTVLDFRSELFRHTSRLPLPYLDAQRAGTFIFQINYHAHYMGSLITSLIPLASSLLTIVGMTIIIFLFNVTLGLITISVMPFIIFSTTYYNRNIEPIIQKTRDLEGQSMTIVHESVSMMRVVVAYCKESFEHAVFRRNGKRAVDARVELTVRQVLFMMVVNLVTVCGNAAVLGYGVYLVVDKQLTTGQLTIVLSYLHAIYQPLESISHQIAHLQESFVNLKSTLKLLDTPIGVAERPEAQALPPSRGLIQLSDVTFAYAGRAPVISNVTFEALPGDVVAVVGPTGAGKTTLVSLISRVVDPAEGTVSIDGHDLRDVTLHSIRSQISTVLQEPLLWGRSIADNICYGHMEATPDEMVAAAVAANAHDFILAQPEGYDTVLGERGSGISGGERQRISIARAFLKDAPILILDEPTSSIDSRTEGVILEALERLMIGRTTILIAHRMATIRSANKILVMDHGQIIEAGRHEDLVHSGGVYSELWAAQMTNVRLVELEDA